GDRLDHPRYLGGRAAQVVDERVHRPDPVPPGALVLLLIEPLGEPAFPPDRPADPLETSLLPLLEGDDVVECVYHLAGESHPPGEPDLKVAGVHSAQRRCQLRQQLLTRFGRDRLWGSRLRWHDLLPNSGVSPSWLSGGPVREPGRPKSGVSPASPACAAGWRVGRTRGVRGGWGRDRPRQREDRPEGAPDSGPPYPSGRPSAGPVRPRAGRPDRIARPFAAADHRAVHQRGGPRRH